MSKLPVGPTGSLSCALHNQQDMAPSPSGEPTNQQFFEWSQRALVLKARVEELSVACAERETERDLSRRVVATKDAEMAVLVGILQEDAREHRIDPDVDCKCAVCRALSTAPEEAKKLLARLKELEAMLACEGRGCNTCELYQATDNACGDALGLECKHDNGDVECLEDDENPFPNWVRRRLTCEK